MGLLQDYLKRLKGLASNQVSNFRVGMNTAPQQIKQANNNFWKPTTQVRSRDFVRELPNSFSEIVKNIAPSTVKYAQGVKYAFNPTRVANLIMSKSSDPMYRNYGEQQLLNDKPSPLTPKQMLKATTGTMVDVATLKRIPVSTALPLKSRLGIGALQGAGQLTSQVLGENMTPQEALTKKNIGTYVGGGMAFEAANPYFAKLSVGKGGVGKTFSTNKGTRPVLVKTEKNSPYQAVEWPKDKPIPSNSRAIESPLQSGVAPELPPSLRPSRISGEQKVVATPATKVPTIKAQEVSNKIGSDVSFDNTIQQTPTDVKNKVNIIDIFRTPDRVLQKIGLGNEAKLLRTQYDKYLKELPQEIDKIGRWAKQTTPEENTRIFKYLDGQGVTLSEKESKIANEVQSYLEEWADKLKLPQDKRISNYITHIFEKDFKGKEFPEELARLIDDKVAGSVYDPFTLERLGKQGYVEDTWRALDAYVKRATRKYNIDAALELIQEKAKTLELSQFKYVKGYIDRINMRPTELDNMIDNFIKSTPIGYKLSQRPTTALTRNARQVVYRGTLGLNVGSALKNLSQGANTYARLGEKYTVKGYIDLFKNFRSSELKDVGVLADDIIQDKNIGVYKGFLNKLDEGLFYLFETAEKINRGAAYYGAKAKALNEGKSLQEAIEFGKKTVRDTQFTFGSIDTPLVLQSDAAKTLLQFQSFNIKQGEFLVEMISKKDFAGLARWIGASMAFVYCVGKAIGMSPKDIIPTIRVGSSPFATIAKEIYNTITNTPDEYGNKPKNTKERFQPLIKSLVPLVPGGVQGKKTIEGLMAYNQGASKTASGNEKFKIQPNTKNAITTALFGQYSNPEARAYFKNKSKTKEEKAKEAKLQERKVYDDKITITADGKFKYSTRGKEHTASDVISAKNAVDKEDFRMTGKNIQVKNDKVFRLQKDGSIKIQPKDEYDYQLNTNKMQKAKSGNDLQTWFNIADQQLNIISKQLQDPTLDELEASDLQEKADKIISDYQKYKGYGGFKNGKKTKKTKSLRLKSVVIKSPSIKNSTKIKISKPTITKKVITGGRGTITKVKLPITRRRTN